MPLSDAVLRSWGRVLSAVGSIQGLTKPLELTRVNVLFVPDDGSSALPVLVGGEPENVDEDRAKEILSEGKFEIKIQLGIGEESAKYWTCDFSYVSLSSLSVQGKIRGEVLGCRRAVYSSSLISPYHPILVSYFQPFVRYIYARGY